jgi:signal peptidase I
MMPTLLVGDFILVNRASYGIPMPFTNRQIMNLKGPKRGEVVVFRYPKDPLVEYIKRIVGVPGDRIRYRNKTLYINGEPSKQQLVGVYAAKGYGASMSGAEERIEILGNKQHNILIMPEAASIEGEYIIQDGEYFVMGDNRDNSNDSRYWGAVPEDNLVGKALFILFGWDPLSEGNGWERIGKIIH